MRTLTTWTKNIESASMCCGPLCLIIWRRATTESAIIDFRERCLRHLELFPDGIIVVGLIEDTAQIPSGEMRRLSAQANDQLSDAGAHIAAVIPTGGFAGAWVRGVITSLHTLARKRYPLEVFASCTELRLWALQHVTGLDAGCIPLLDQFRIEHAAYCRQLK